MVEHIIPQKAIYIYIYKWYILPIGGLGITYHRLREPWNSIDHGRIVRTECPTQQFAPQDALQRPRMDQGIPQWRDDGIFFSAFFLNGDGLWLVSQCFCLIFIVEIFVDIEQSTNILICIFIYLFIFVLIWVCIDSPILEGIFCWHWRVLMFEWTVWQNFGTDPLTRSSVPSPKWVGNSPSWRTYYFVFFLA